MQITVPTVHLNSGLDWLLASIQPAWASPEPVTLDFSGCSFISAQGIAVVCALVLRRRQAAQPTAIAHDRIDPDVRRQLGRWKLDAVLGCGNHPWTDNAIPLLHQQTREPAELVDYVRRQVVDSAKMPRMTDDLAKEVRKAFCEILGNIFRHAESPIGGLAIGQLYPRVKQFQICVCDAGIGLVSRIQGAGHALDSPTSAITWALQPGTSTATDGQPGGLGLYLLREFVKVNGGELGIYANSGYYEESSQGTSARLLAAPFPGTILHIRLNVRDDVTYGIRYE